MTVKCYEMAVKGFLLIRNNYIIVKANNPSIYNCSLHKSVVHWFTFRLPQYRYCAFNTGMLQMWRKIKISQNTSSLTLCYNCSCILYVPMSHYRPIVARLVWNMDCLTYYLSDYIWYYCIFCYTWRANSINHNLYHSYPNIHTQYTNKTLSSTIHF